MPVNVPMVRIGKDGVQHWYGEYPSMCLPTGRAASAGPRSLNASASRSFVAVLFAA
jgi:hypothetical protein